MNYHFGGKDGLLAAVFDRRLRPVNQERLELLDAFERAAGDGPVPLDQILYANLAPPFRMLDESGEPGQRFMRIVARINADPSSSIHEAFLRHFDLIRTRFLAALRRALPDLEATEVERRFHYSLAAMFHTFCWGAHIPCLSATSARATATVVLSSLIAYTAAGLQSRPTRGSISSVLRRLESACSVAMYRHEMGERHRADSMLSALGRVHREPRLRRHQPETGIDVPESMDGGEREPGEATTGRTSGGTISTANAAERLRLHRALDFNTDMLIAAAARVQPGGGTGAHCRGGSEVRR